MASPFIWEEIECYRLFLDIPDKCSIVSEKYWGKEVRLEVRARDLESVKHYCQKYHIKIPTIEPLKVSFASLSDEAKAELTIDQL